MPAQMDFSSHRTNFVRADWKLARTDRPMARTERFYAAQMGKCPHRTIFVRTASPLARTGQFFVAQNDFKGARMKLELPGSITRLIVPVMGRWRWFGERALLSNSAPREIHALWPAFPRIPPPDWNRPRCQRRR